MCKDAVGTPLPVVPAGIHGQKGGVLADELVHLDVSPEGVVRELAVEHTHLPEGKTVGVLREGNPILAVALFHFLPLLYLIGGAGEVP